jgi:hypothetical protein
MIRPGKVAPMGNVRNSCKILAENTEGKRSLGRPRLRWEYTPNIITDLRGIGSKIRDWVYLAQDKVNDHRLLLIVVLFYKVYFPKFGDIIVLITLSCYRRYFRDEVCQNSSLLRCSEHEWRDIL